MWEPSVSLMNWRTGMIAQRHAGHCREVGAGQVEHCLLEGSYAVGELSLHRASTPLGRKAFIVQGISAT